ncbi:hypothetical protein NMY22_g1033 [Coprinellus aureogranulatus]|nr:hypothetical protein NMY22_g1033 [Coprinellus aureogranulatus]
MSLISTPHPLRLPSKNHLSSSSSKKKTAPWYLHTSYTHSHVGVVRALYVDDRRGVVVTGGEDARLNVWRDLTPSAGLFAGNEMEDQEDDEEGEEEGDGDGMDVDEREEEKEDGREGRRRKRGVSLSDDEMDGRKRRR